MSIGLELNCSLPRSSLILGEGRSDDNTCRLVRVARAGFPRSTWRKKQLVVTSHCCAKPEKCVSGFVPYDVEKSGETCSLGLGLAVRAITSPRGSRETEEARGTTWRRDGLLACQMLGKIGLDYRKCGASMVAKAAKDGVEGWKESGMPEVVQPDAVSPTDGGVKKGDDEERFDAGGNVGEGGGGAGRGGSDGGGGNHGSGNAGGDNANDGVPWWWWLLCTAGSGSNRSSGIGQNAATAGFRGGLFDVIVRAIVLALREPLFELAQGLAGFISFMAWISSDPFEAAFTGMIVGIIGLPIALVGLVVSWICWRWTGHPSCSEQQQEEEEDGDHNFCST